ncbi:transcription regulator [Lactobacillus plantarum JDM1] [Lactiplantibacillus mudanjiangensis]|nr:transcription regulator [Lactobacillus plantarum JDM1] [Lactiplantibacillus mudanjiangensis]
MYIKNYPEINRVCFFFFKQKTAYEIPLRLVGSEMCIRDRFYTEFTNALSITHPKAKFTTRGRLY